MKAVIVLPQSPGRINSESNICSAHAPRVFGNQQIAPEKFFPPCVCVLVLTQVPTFTIGITRTRRRGDITVRNLGVSHKFH